VTVAVVARDLMIATRIADAAASAGVEVLRFDDPAQLTFDPELRLVLVAWDERRPDWGNRLVDWHTGMPDSRPARIVLFGPHTDLAAHAEARAAGLGPMWARSKLVSMLPGLLAGEITNP
jgi:hypothetical protein